MNLDQNVAPAACTMQALSMGTGDRVGHGASMGTGILMDEKQKGDLHEDLAPLSHSDRHTREVEGSTEIQSTTCIMCGGSGSGSCRQCILLG